MLTDLFGLIRKRQKQQAIFSTLPGVMSEGARRKTAEERVLEKKPAEKSERKDREPETGASRSSFPRQPAGARPRVESMRVIPGGEASSKFLPHRTSEAVSGPADRGASSPEATAGKEEKLVVRETHGRKETRGQKDPEPSRKTEAGGGAPHAPRRRSHADPFDSVDFRYIPPGVFLMGSHEEEPGRHDDELYHEVTLTSGFLIQTTLVTRRQWKMTMGADPSSFPAGGLECPVDGVNWNDCQEFIRKLNAAGTCRYRLPTEAEWEYACRAGTSAAFGHEGVDFAEDGHYTGLDEIAWYSCNSMAKPHPVAVKKPNAWGLYDMHGNLCEWCQDWYGAYSGEPVTNPSGSPTGFKRVSRGGCWVSTARNCRSACRFSWEPDWRSDFVGFRLVREIL
ncbi:MAG: SUMF1/EgtB/PvdO family nonheme iron enzyme [Syntrophobacteraceae bacterium]|nr:SUMF1/EgtB/PvdO family nonheme iron enzyme [Desulfobacteraceae bacterium]